MAQTIALEGIISCSVFHFHGYGLIFRFHELRHTFAVHSLKRIVLSGKDLAVYHQVLKTYMGHSFFKYTAYYLQLTKDMFPDIRMKVEAHYNEMFNAGGNEHG